MKKRTKDPSKGERKGFLVATGEVEVRPYSYNKKEVFVQFLCDCGNLVWLRKCSFAKRTQPSCGQYCEKRMSLYKIQPGDRIESLTIEERIPKKRGQSTDQAFICLCDCGNREEVSASRLKVDKKIKCSVCYERHLEKDMQPGTKFGFFTLTGNKIYKPKRYECICRCGKIVFHLKTNLVDHKNSQCRECFLGKI